MFDINSKDVRQRGGRIRALRLIWRYGRADLLFRSGSIPRVDLVRGCSDDAAPANEVPFQCSSRIQRDVRA
jgi:hypothetical protein